MSVIVACAQAALLGYLRIRILSVMESVLKMDIFFFVTTLVVAVVGTLVAILIYYLIGVMRNVRDISDTVKKEAEETIRDFRSVRKDVKESAERLKKFGQAAAGANMLAGAKKVFDAFTSHEAPSKRATRKRTTRKKKEQSGE